MADRREPRIPQRLPVSIGRKLAALSNDISSQGFCLETPMSASFTKGQAVDGYVLHGEKELPFRGTVSWFTAGHPQLSTWSRVGVQFSWVSPGLRALLSVAQRSRSARRVAK